ncbi:MAG: hypothetical protein ABR579_08395 [Actinomycetota bacterium]
MTIADGATLTKAVHWQVKAKPAADDAIQAVEFLIDGNRKWVEENPPYSFDEDFQFLPPWLLGNGHHVLTAHVITSEGASADATAHIRVDVDLSKDKMIAGTYRRLVTKADQKRVASYRVPAKGAFGEQSPTGRWTIQVKKNGEIIGVDPKGDTSSPFVEPYTLDGSKLTLYGPAVWRQPHPDPANLFCEPEKASDYTWSLSGSSLTIKNIQKACADRDIVFVGTWTRT